MATLSYDFKSFTIRTQFQGRNITIQAWQNTKQLIDDACHFGFVYSGPSHLKNSGQQTLRAGMYFCFNGGAELQGGSGIIISHQGYHGLPVIGGPIEEKGRLKYIDGCSDTLLIAPPILGDPCLNLLYIPSHTEQTSHDHPSLRAGIIVSGHGICRTPQRDHELKPGTLFFLAPLEEHCFVTSSTPLRVIAFHPDSDFGPTHQNHPMLNRTYIDGISAAQSRRERYP